jgi:hypothetical protein
LPVANDKNERDCCPLRQCITCKPHRHSTLVLYTSEVRVQTRCSSSAAETRMSAPMSIQHVIFCFLTFRWPCKFIWSCGSYSPVFGRPYNSPLVDVESDINRHIADFVDCLRSDCAYQQHYQHCTYSFLMSGSGADVDIMAAPRRRSI